MSKKTETDLEILRIEHLFDKGIDYKGRSILITGSIEEHTFDFVDAAMSELERQSTRSGITIKINSPGGDMYEALAIVDRIKSSPRHVTTVCYGHAMSAASLILSAGDKRLMGSRSWFMHHEPSYAASGRHSVNKQEVSQTERELQEWCRAMAEFSNQDYDFWYRATKNLDFYLNAQQCLELGIVDKIF